MKISEAIERLEYLKAKAQVALEQEIPEWVAEDILGTIEAYDMAIDALRKTENCSEKPNNCENHSGEVTEMVEPQTERIKTLDYCDICNHKGCDNCIANNLDDYCVPSGYEPITQTETQNSNLTFEKADERCKGCKHYKLTCDLFSEICKYEPKDEPQTSGVVWTEDAIKNEPKSYTTWASTDEPQIDDIGNCNICKYVGLEHRCNQCVNGSQFYKIEDEPQTDVWEYHNGEWTEPQTDCAWK